MQLQHERQLHQRDKKTMAARHDADQQRISNLRSVALIHQRHCRKWEKKILGHTYPARNQPIFSLSQSLTPKSTLNLVGRDLHMSSDEDSVLQNSPIKKLHQAQLDYASAVSSSRLPTNYLGLDAIRVKMASKEATMSLHSSSSVF